MRIRPISEIPSIPSDYSGHGQHRFPIAREERFAPAPGNMGGQGGGSILVDWWRMLRRHRKLILLSGLAGLIASVLFTLPQVPKYRAFTLLELQSLNGDFLDLKSVDPNAASGQFPIESTVQTQVKVVQSEPVMFRSMDRMKLYTAHRQSKKQSLFSGILGHFGWSRPTSVPTENLVEKVAGTVRVRPIGPTRIIEITAESADPYVAALYANTIADEYMAQTVAARSISSEETSKWLRSQLAELRGKLEEAESNLEAYAQKSSLLFPESSDSKTGLSVAQQRLEQLQVGLSAAEADRVAKQSMYEQSQSQNPDSLPPVLDNGPIRDYQLRLADLRRQLAELSATLMPTHPKVRRVKQQIAEVESTMEHERSNVVARMRREYDAAKRRENLLNVAYQSQSAIVAGQEAKRVRYGTLKSEVELNRQLFEAMLHKVKEADFAKALRANSVQVVNPAMIPNRPVSPNVRLNLLLGVALGFFGGLAVVFVREGAEAHIRFPGQSAEHLETRELGVIPRAHAPQISLAKMPGLPSPPSIAVHVNGSHKATAISARPKSKPTLLSECFRSVLQSILFTAQSGTPARLITVTSPDPGDGKTTVVSNLAFAISELRKSVLLIDCDMRRPRLHKLFNFENESGISDFLLSDDQPEFDRIQKYMRKTGTPGVTLIPSGHFPDDIAYQLSSERWHRMLRTLRERFDMVILDTPPIMLSPDARILGKISDGVVLVLRSGKTTVSSAYAVRECLMQDGIRLLGTVLNDWTPEESPYYKKYREYYS